MMKPYHLNEAILDILVPNPARDTSAIADALDEQDWDYVLERGHEHRFLPLLNWSLGQSGALEQVPLTVRDALAANHRRHIIRALTVQRELILVHRLMANANIEHVFLKGSFLSQFAYPHPALRPVRDLDVVVRPDEVERVQTMMVAAGYTPRNDAPGMVAAYVEQAKHLPGFISPSRKVCIEIHIRVDHAGGVLTGMDAFRKVSNRELAGEMLPFMDPTDLLVHLCVHAANFHGFDNGPLIVADIGFLLQTAGLDAENIMTRAAELGVAKPVALTLALTESCWVHRRNDLSALSEPVSTEMLTAARQLCLRRWGKRSNINFFVSLATPRSKLEAALVLLKLVFPSGKRLALDFGQPRSKVHQMWFYLKRWQRILVERGPDLARGRRGSSSSAEFENATRLKKWLES